MFIGFCALPISFAGNGKKPHFAPIQSHSGGQTYGEWAAEWWQVALETPASYNPLFDEDGSSCDVGDVGNVWFLFGTFGGDPVVRNCEIPVGKAIFFPLINIAQTRFVEDPDDNRTEEELREDNECIKDAELYFYFNSKPIDGLNQYFEESPTFQVQFPLSDAIYGLNGFHIDLAADAGFYLFLRPLPPGDYELHWITSSEACDFGQDITYNLTISRGPK